jgi:hypothetical protein
LLLQATLENVQQRYRVAYIRRIYAGVVCHDPGSERVSDLRVPKVKCAKSAEMPKVEREVRATGYKGLLCYRRKTLKPLK